MIQLNFARDLRSRQSMPFEERRQCTINRRCQFSHCIYCHTGRAADPRIAVNSNRIVPQASKFFATVVASKVCVLNWREFLEQIFMHLSRISSDS
jgi:hypothetical protein